MSVNKANPNFSRRNMVRELSAPVDVHLFSYKSGCNPFNIWRIHPELSFRRKMATLLRSLSDWIDSERGHTDAIVIKYGKDKKIAHEEDVFDSLKFGSAPALNYLSELSVDRNITERLNNENIQ